MAPVAASGQTMPAPLGSVPMVSKVSPSSNGFGVPGFGSVMVSESSGTSELLTAPSVTVLGSPARTVSGVNDLLGVMSSDVGGIR